MKSVRELLKVRPEAVFTVPPDASVREALEMLAEKDVGALPVVEDAALIGIFSERDYARGVVLRGRSSREMKVRELMVHDVVSVTPTDTIQHCMETMTSRRIRHLPVLDDERLVGIVTIGDVVKQVISDQTHTIEQLQNYIQGH